MFDGPAHDTARVGFAVAAVARDGRLAGLAHGLPPRWVDSAPGAELWALRVVLALCGEPPPIVTDCRALLNGLALGPAAARDPKRPHARTWGMVLAVLDSPAAAALARERLVWMPAHGSAAATTGRALRSDG